MTIREIFEEARQMTPLSIPDEAIHLLLMENNQFQSFTEMRLAFHSPMKQATVFFEQIKRLIEGEPVQYILNKAYFFDRDFFVDDRVLIPRVETEELVFNVLNILNKDYNNRPLSLVDIGTGSGCIAIELASHHSFKKVYATDISTSALEVAAFNAKQSKTPISFLQGDLLEPLIERQIKVDVLVSNPPYIVQKKDVDPMVLDYEPHLALFAEHGIDYYERIFADAPKVLSNHSLLYFEIGYDLEEKLQYLVEKYFPHMAYTFYKDMQSKVRFLRINYVKI